MLVQPLPALGEELCCKEYPVLPDDQEIARLFVGPTLIESDGTLGSITVTL